MSATVPPALLVTGAARGIGAATARLAAAEGWSVGISFRVSGAAADALADDIRAAGGRAVTVGGDVSDERDVRRMFDRVEDAFGPLRGLVNNAGMLERAAPLAEISLERWSRVLAVNSTGSFLCAREAVRRMMPAGGGAIVNVSSMAVVLGGSNEFVDYAASKGAVEAMTIGLAREVARHGIRVNAVRPGVIETDMQAASGDPGRAERLRPSVPMNRIGRPEEVAEAILWLLSERASYATGSVVTVSGGR